MTGAVERAVMINKAVPDKLKIEELDTDRKVMNKLMMRYVEQVRIEPKKYIRERTAIERLFNIAPAELRNGGKPIMFKDPHFNYGKLFLLGMDFDFLMLEVCVLSLMN